MFDRYTDHARNVVYVTEALAQASRHPQAGTGHLLVGIMYEHGSKAWQALTSLGLTTDTVRTAVCATLKDAPHAPWTRNTPFSPRLQTVLQDAAREAIRLGCTYIGTEHMLLAAVAEREPAEGNDGYRGTGIEALGRLDLEAADVRDAMTAVLDGTLQDHDVAGGHEHETAAAHTAVLKRLDDLEQMLSEHCGEAHVIQRKLGLVE